MAEDKVISEKKVKTLISERQQHRVVHEDDLEWQRIRWPGEWGKVAFHPREGDPTEPIFGITRFEGIEIVFDSVFEIKTFLSSDDAKSCMP